MGLRPRGHDVEMSPVAVHRARFVFGIAVFGSVASGAIGVELVAVLALDLLVIRHLRPLKRFVG